MLVVLSVLLLGAQADAVAAAPPAGGHQQIFIAPSGEPFRTYGSVPYPVAQWFAGADKNGDGKLDFAEFEADFLRFFDQLDTNHDGAIDGAERAQYENRIAPETLGGAWVDETAGEGDGGLKIGFDSADSNSTEREPPKPKYGANPTGAARFDLLGMPEPVAAMDSQLHGRITRNDAIEAARQRFNELDTLHRGYLTLDTLPRTFAEDHRHGGGGGRTHRHR